jgi:hypothetical protein
VFEVRGGGLRFFNYFMSKLNIPNTSCGLLGPDYRGIRIIGAKNITALVAPGTKLTDSEKLGLDKINIAFSNNLSREKSTFNSVWGHRMFLSI